jgi:hypothetical protein
MFEEEVEKARLLNVKLSFGIGVFQGCTNLFINGIVLGVLAYEPTLPLIVKNVRINHNIEKASKPIPKNK